MEGRDKNGNPNGGWDPHELRTIQDFYVKYSLTSAKGVAEVASIGGFVKEYQIDVDPNAMKANNVSISSIIRAVKNSNLDIGARTMEVNRAEYLIRAIGYIKNPEDIENSVIQTNDNTPIRIKDVAKVNYGPANRRGGLDKDGIEAVGGVVVARYGSNPMEVINNVKDKIEEVEDGLPSKILDDGTTSKVTIVPFYDRSGLIKETLGTLEEALNLEILISIIVVIILVLNLRASLLISSILPIGVLMTFIVMRRFNVDANIVALSGIAIAIGVMVDVGVVFTENIIRHFELAANKGKKKLIVIYEATVEVAPAVLTALTTTIISFLPVFAMEASEGKLFKPLAFTKTFAMISALILGLIIIPTLAHLVFSIKLNKKKTSIIFNSILIISGISFVIISKNFIAIAIVAVGINNLFESFLKLYNKKTATYINIAVSLIFVLYFLSKVWMPLGASKSLLMNFAFVSFSIGLIIGFLYSVIHFYPRLLKSILANKWQFLSVPILIILFGIISWQGFDKIFGFAPDKIKQTNFYTKASETFPGIGKEFMPSLDEGSFLLMPTTMPHSGIEENLEVIKMLDRKINSIPEVENVIGKWGRVNSALDPAPVSMFENVINYKPEYILDDKGHRLRFKVNNRGEFILNDGTVFSHENDNLNEINTKNLIPDKNGKYFRQWRSEIESADDIWNAIIDESKIPGLTSAPKLQPIQTRLVMLQTGMRAPIGIKVFGPDLKTIEDFAFKLENILKDAEGVSEKSVFADRVVGKPYLEINIDRKAIARYGINIQDVQSVLSSAVGGKELTSTVEGRERFPVRVRYAREYRDDPESIKNILIPAPNGQQIPLEEISKIEYRRGPQMIKSENTFLVAYVIFDKKDGYAEVDVVENAKKTIQNKIDNEELKVPAGVNYVFTGNYKNQIRATKRLLIVVPLALIIIFLILYFQFKSVASTSFIFSGIFLAFAGGFIMLWLYGQDWFMNFNIAGVDIREMLQIKTINLSVAVWVGFIALFGIATDDGVLISTYLKQSFDKKQPETIDEVRKAVETAGLKRVRPAMMTTATTLIALLPVLTSTGKGSDIMVPMAIPIVGGMLIAVLTIFIVPVLYSMWMERKIKKLIKPLNK